MASGASGGFKTGWGSFEVVWGDSEAGCRRSKRSGVVPKLLR